MKTQDSIVRRVERSRWNCAGLAFGAALLLSAAAQADSDFEDGFEDMLGRMVAVGVVQAAQTVVFGAPAPVVVAAPAYYPPPVVVVAPPVYYAPPPVYYAPVAPVYVGRPYWGSRFVYHGGHGSHGHGHHRGHGGDHGNHGHNDNRGGHGGYDRNDRGGQSRYANR